MRTSRQTTASKGPVAERVEHRPAEEPLDQIFNVFTLRDTRIVRIEDFRGRREALTASGVADDADWR
jgi:hypothetical protein